MNKNSSNRVIGPLKKVVSQPSTSQVQSTITYNNCNIPSNGKRSYRTIGTYKVLLLVINIIATDELCAREKIYKQ